MAEAVLVQHDASAQPARFAVIVSFELEPGARDHFLRLVRDNAAASLADERGCLVFDVLRPEDPGDESVSLYEAYVDRAAFDAHLATRHYAAFDAASRGLVTIKAVRAFSIEPRGLHELTV